MKYLKLWIGLILLTLGAGTAAWILSQRGAGASSAEVSAEGTAIAPSRPFRLKDAAGASHSLSDYAGKAVLLHFWATWCEPCVEEIPALMEFSRKLEGREFRLLLVSLDETWEQAWEVLPKVGLPENVVSLIDPDSKVPELYGSYQFPESYLIDPDQRIVAKWVGMQKWEDPYFVKAIDKVLKP